jgi:asparagine synthase (glutamine-hydrolysing)
MNITVFRDIQQVPPSSVVIISEGKTSVKQYSLIDPHYRITLSRDEEYEEALRSILAESVRSKLRSRGKHGSLLCGGLDSGMVASIAGRELSYPLHTYTVKPNENFHAWADGHEAAEEIEALEETVRYAGNIKNRMLTLDGSHPLEKLDNHLTMLETPFKLPDTFFRREEVHEAAKKDSVRVLLNGFRGGNTISWGSHRLNHYYYTELLKKMKWKQLNGELSSYAARYGMARTKLLPVMAKKALRQKIRDSGSMPNWINPDLAKKTGVFELCRKYSYPLNDLEEHELSNFRKRSLMQNFHWNNEGNASAKLSLHTGVWERDPTNDYRIIQFCLAIPEEQFIKHGLERSLARRASRNILPESVRFLPHREKFPAADIVYRMKEAWGDFRLEAEEMVREGRLAEWVDMTYIAEIVEEMPGVPSPSYAEDVCFRIISRCVVLNRFIKMHGSG